MLSKQSYIELLAGLGASLLRLVSIFFHKLPFFLTIHLPQKRRMHLYDYYFPTFSQLKPGLATAEVCLHRKHIINGDEL